MSRQRELACYVVELVFTHTHRSIESGLEADELERQRQPLSENLASRQHRWHADAGELLVGTDNDVKLRQPPRSCHRHLDAAASAADGCPDDGLCSKGCTDWTTTVTSAGDLQEDQGPNTRQESRTTMVAKQAQVARRSFEVVQSIIIGWRLQEHVHPELS